jgi:transcriptional regulator with XRE-family HTH domain
VNVERLGRLARMLRVRQHLTQVALAARAGVGRRAVSLLANGRADGLRLREVEAIVGTLGGRLDMRLLWNGPELDRLLDAAHAALGASVKRRLERWGWLVRVEVSYSHFGERGRIDLLAFHPATRTLLVIELKSELVDVQALLGSLDVKTRLASRVAGRFGWSPRVVVPAIVFLEHSATRKRLARLDSLFDQFDLRGREALSWLRRASEAAPRGLLWFANGRQRAGSEGPRVRVRGGRQHPGWGSGVGQCSRMGASAAEPSGPMVVPSVDLSLRGVRPHVTVSYRSDIHHAASRVGHCSPPEHCPKPSCAIPGIPRQPPDPQPG